MPRRPIRSGTALDRNITVLGAVEGRQTLPVYIVWNHRAWCPMACKLFDSLANAHREAAAVRPTALPGSSPAS